VAPGRIEFQGAVSDGFASAQRSAVLSGGRSFDIGVEGGGALFLGPGALIRTGTGNVSIEAGRDLLLTGPKSVVYTAGSHTGWADGFSGAPAGVRLGEFPARGGDVEIRAGRDVVAPLSAQTASAWLFRSGSTDWKGSSGDSVVKEQASWSVVHRNFEQAIGALGGGDVRVDAGRDVVRLQVALPTSGQLTTPVGQVARASDLVVRGGGNLDVHAGRDILGGIFLLGRGHADLHAGGRAVADPGIQATLRTNDSGQVLGTSRPVAVLFGLMDATATLTAGSTVDVEGVFDPMSQGQLRGATGNVDGTGGSAFMGYTERASLDATSIGGSISYQNDPWASVDLSKGSYLVRMSGAGSGAGLQASSLNSIFSRAPGTLRLASLSGSAWLTDPFEGQASQLTLGSAQRGTLEILARGDVHLLTSVTMQGEAPGLRRSALQPFSTEGDATVLGVIADATRTSGSDGRCRARAVTTPPRS
jgi:hypothetical protein